MKQKPFSLIEGNSEINNVNFYDKVNKIIEEERKKNANISAVQNGKQDTKNDPLQCTL